MSHCWYILPPVDTPTLLLICLPCCHYAHPAVNTPALLSIRPPCCQYVHPTVNMPASCWYACLLSICPPCCRSLFPAFDVPTLLLIPAVNMPASCQYTCLLSICPPCCQSRFPAVNMPTLLSICPAVHTDDRPTLLLIHLHPYWYTCAPIDTPALAVIVVGCGAADESWHGGGVDAHIPQGGEGQGMSSRWWWWSTCMAWCKVHIRQLGPGWNLWVVGGTMATVSSHRWQGLL